MRVATRPPGPGAGGLTPGEPEVLHLLADGLSNRAVARRPAISQSTVIRQVANLFAKLRAHTRAEAVREGCARGLITISR